MKLGVFNSFKKSLADSSRIVSDSRVSSSFNEINVLETLQKHRPTSQSSCIGRLSFDQSRGSNEYNSRIIKRIPLLISQNDELKEKIKRLEEQLNHLQSTHNNSIQNRRHTFSFRQDNNKKDQQSNNHFEEHLTVQNSIDKQINSIKTVQSSLGTVRQRITDKQHQGSAKKNNNKKNYSDNQATALRQRIKYLQIQNQLLRRNNENLTDQYAKIIQNKFKHQQDIQEIVHNFQDTLRRKEELHAKQMNQLKQNISTISHHLQQKNKQLEAHKEQNNILNVKLSQNSFQIKNQLSLMQQIALLESQLQKITMQLQQANKNYVLNQNIEHLWTIKEVQYQNMIGVIESLINFSP